MRNEEHPPTEHGRGASKDKAIVSADSENLRVWLLTIAEVTKAYTWQISAQRAAYRQTGRGHRVTAETALLVHHDPAIHGVPDAFLVTTGWCNCAGSERRVYLARMDAEDAVAADAERQAERGQEVSEAEVVPFVITDRKPWGWRS